MTSRNKAATARDLNAAIIEMKRTQLRLAHERLERAYAELETSKRIIAKAQAELDAALQA